MCLWMSPTEEIPALCEDVVEGKQLAGVISSLLSNFSYNSVERKSLVYNRRHYRVRGFNNILNEVRNSNTST